METRLKKWAGWFLIFGLFATIVPAKAASKHRSQRTRQSKQLIYLEFERADQTNRVIWLKLVNASKWQIEVETELGAPLIAAALQGDTKASADGSARPLYYIDAYEPGSDMQLIDKDGKKEPPDQPTHPPTPKIVHGDLALLWPVQPKQIMYFKIPFEHLARNCALYVEIKYPWFDQVSHRVYFRGPDLPQDVQMLIN